MIYEYNCKACELSFDVVKPAKDMDLPEPCKACGVNAERHFAPRALYFIGTKVENAEFNPGLGCIVKNKAHKRDIMKAKGVEEVGSEPIDKIHKHYDDTRSEKIERAYEETTAGWVGDGSS